MSKYFGMAGGSKFMQTCNVGWLVFLEFVVSSAAPLSVVIIRLAVKLELGSKNYSMTLQTLSLKTVDHVWI